MALISAVAGLPRAETEAIVAGNCARLYGIGA